MAAQLLMFNISDFVPGKIKNKRVHFKIPTYTKKYTFTSINPDTNELQYLGDEKHIFRIRTLQKLYSIIYGYCDINLFEQFEVKRIGNIIVWGEDKQAEIANTSRLPIKQRVIIHLKLLRLLRNGFSIKEALCKLNLTKEITENTTTKTKI